MKTTDLARALGEMEEALQELPPLQRKPLRFRRTLAAALAAVMLLCMSALATSQLWSFDTQENQNKHGKSYQSIVLIGELPQDAPTSLEIFYRPRHLSGKRTLRFVERTEDQVTWAWSDFFYFTQMTVEAFEQEPRAYLPGVEVVVTQETLGGREVYFDVSPEGDGCIWWTDGQYCYCITSNDVPLRRLSTVVESLEQVSVEEVDRLAAEYPFIRTHSPVLERYYVPGFVPEGMTMDPEAQLDSISLSWQLYGQEPYGLVFEQRCLDAITADTQDGVFDGRTFLSLRQIPVGGHTVEVRRVAVQEVWDVPNLEYYWTEGNVSFVLRLDPEFEATLEDPDALASLIILDLQPVQAEDVSGRLQDLAP